LGKHSGEQNNLLLKFLIVFFFKDASMFNVLIKLIRKEAFNLNKNKAFMSKGKAVAPLSKFLQ
jgi:hypothetical protein